MNDFSDSEKKLIFDRIAELYFNKNFGTISKSDFEVLLFSEFITHMKSVGKPSDDYTVSKELGITQSRVRSLKERMELRYPSNHDWRDDFVRLLPKAKYDKDKKVVKVVVDDVNLLSEIRHYIETKGWYDEYSLNRKLLSIPVSCFVDVIVKDEDINKLFSDETKRKVRKIKSNNSSVKEFLKDFSKEGFKDFLQNVSKVALMQVLGNMAFSQEIINGLIDLFG